MQCVAILVSAFCDALLEHVLGTHACRSYVIRRQTSLPFIGNGKRVHYERGLFTGGISKISKSLENGRILLYFPDSGESLNSLESLESELFWKGPFSKRPLFPNPNS